MLFMNLVAVNEKVRKDRGINRSLDENIVEFGRWAAVSILGINIFSIGFTITSKAGSWPVITSTALALAFSLYTLMLAIQFDSIYARGAKRWRRLFYLALLTSISLSALSIGYSWEYLNASSSILVCFVYVVLSFSSVVYLSPSYRFYSVFNLVVWVLTPIAIMLLSSVNIQSVHIISLCFSLCVLVCLLGYVQANKFWQLQEDKFLTEQKLYALSAQQATHKTESAFNSSQYLNINRGLTYGINDIIAGVSLLNDDGEPETFAEIQKYVKRVAIAQLRKLDSIEDYVKLQGGKLPVENSAVNLVPELEALFFSIGSFAKLRNIRLNYCIASDFPSRIKCDSQKVCQALENYLNYRIETCSTGDLFVSVDVVGELNVGEFIYIDTVDVPNTTAKSNDDLKPNDDTLVDTSGLMIGEAIIKHLGGDVVHAKSKNEQTNIKIPVTTVSHNRAEIDLRDTFRHSLLELHNVPPSMKTTLHSAIEDWGMAFVDHDDDNVSDGVSSKDVKRMVLVFIDHESDAKYVANKLELAEYDSVIYVINELNHILGVEHQGPATDTDPSDNVYKLSAPLSTRRLKELLYTIHRDNGDAKLDSKEKNQIAANIESCGKILLVEDQKVNQLVAAGMLKKLGYQPSLAQDGKEALLMLEQDEYDLILMDCQMTGMDGFAATEAIRDREKLGTITRHIPIIALTAHSAAEDQTRCMAVGMDDCLTKPVQFNQLEGSIRRWLGRDQSQISH
ncbi:hypothetical protein NBRC116495_07020 [Aurantivibrio plasticivorans]